MTEISIYRSALLLISSFLFPKEAPGQTASSQDLKTGISIDLFSLLIAAAKINRSA